MATLLYIHGFLSSPESKKAQQVKVWLQQQRPDIDYCCPQLTPYPDACAKQLEDTFLAAQQPVYLMGSSLGGFWATWLVERFYCKALLINPAVNVMDFMPDYIDCQLTNYHHNDTYFLTREHLRQLQTYCIDSPLRLNNYWLLLQTGDETLDYRLAVAKYSGCRQTVESGGDHSFKNFERYFNDAMVFFESE